MPTPSLGLHVFLAINKFLTIDNLFIYIYIYMYIVEKQENQLVYSIIDLFHPLLMDSSDVFEESLFFLPLTPGNILSYAGLNGKNKRLFSTTSEESINNG